MAFVDRETSQRFPINNTNYSMGTLSISTRGEAGNAQFYVSLDYYPDRLTHIHDGENGLELHADANGTWEAKTLAAVLRTAANYIDREVGR